MLARALVVLSALFLAVRLYAAGRLGFGDAESLYATYALFPQPAYLDHPGLIGAFGRALATAGAPSPRAAHLASTLIATAVPFLAAAAARSSGASRDRAAVAGLALLAAPEIAVGLFGFTPDVLLCPLWLLALAFAARAFTATPGSTASTTCFVGLGAAMGLAILAKAPGVFLLVAFAITIASPHGRAYARRAGPWLAIAMCMLLLAPLARFEFETGFRLFHHRLVATQTQAGFSVRNAAALVFGQLAYLSPLLAVGAALALAALRRLPSRDAFDTFLRASALSAAAGLGLLCLWSRVAEPHWFAPAWLGLPVFVARHDWQAPRMIRRYAVPLGVACSLVVDALVLTDLLPRALGQRYVARYDLANDMYTWPQAVPRVRAALANAQLGDEGAQVVLTPHWALAAQLQAGLGPSVRVGTVGAPIEDDFASWLPKSTWAPRRSVLWVTDDRFPSSRPSDLADWAMLERSHVSIYRGGKVVRRVTIETLLHADTG